MATTTVTKQLGMGTGLSSRVRFLSVQFLLASDETTRGCNQDQMQIVAVMRIVVLGQVRGRIGRGMKIIKGAGLTKITDKII